MFLSAHWSPCLLLQNWARSLHGMLQYELIYNLQHMHVHRSTRHHLALEGWTFPCRSMPKSRLDGSSTQKTPRFSKPREKYIWRSQCKRGTLRPMSEQKSRSDEANGIFHEFLAVVQRTLSAFDQWSTSVFVFPGNWTDVDRFVFIFFRELYRCWLFEAIDQSPKSRYFQRRLCCVKGNIWLSFFAPPCLSFRGIEQKFHSFLCDIARSWPRAFHYLQHVSSAEFDLYELVVKLDTPLFLAWSPKVSHWRISVGFGNLSELYFEPIRRSV